MESKEDEIGIGQHSLSQLPPMEGDGSRKEKK